VPGHGQGVRLGYLWMLAGNDHTIKPDRMVLRWMCIALDRAPAMPEARNLLAAGRGQLEVTPWALDHAIWSSISP